MEQDFLNKTEAMERGDSLYERLRPAIEIAENVGKIISMDIETGDYEIDADVLKAGRRLQERHPQALIVAKRIGYDAVYSLGGTLTRTATT